MTHRDGSGNHNCSPLAREARRKNIDVSIGLKMRLYLTFLKIYA